MPSDDVILNLRQIAGYPQAVGVVSTDVMLLQRGGLGGPYLGVSPAVLVSTALAQGGSLNVGGPVLAQAVQAGAGQFSNLATGLLTAQTAEFTEFNSAWGTLAGEPIATQTYVDTSIAGLGNQVVWSVNGRKGDIILSLCDIPGAAPLWSPRFGGDATSETPPLCDSSSRIATTAFVQRAMVCGLTNLLRDHPFVFSFNGRTGDIVLTPDDLAAVNGAPLNDAQLTGTPTAPTAPVGTNSNQIATTAFVDNLINDYFGGEPGSNFAPINSPSFTGYPSAPTAPPGSVTGQIATTAFVMNAVEASTAGVASFNTRTGIVALQAADITGVGGALLVSPAFTGSPTAPTQAPGTANTTLATTAFVAAATAANAGVTAFNTRTGAITLTGADITGAGGALLASPTFTGTPQGPTAAPSTSTTQLATTAFVAAALAAAAGVTTFNGRTGAVTLTASDISAAGGAALAGPAFTGVPSAPTAAVGTDTTQLATTAFVQAALATAGGVDSFNGRAGAVTLTGADITGAGGALMSQVTAALAAYLPLAGGTLTGTLNGIAATFVGTLTLTGPASQLNIAPTSGTGANILLSKLNSSVSNNIYGLTAGVNRWVMALGNNNPESGSNVGSDFYLARYTDAGVFIDTPISITRNIGQFRFNIPAGTGGANFPNVDSPAGSAKGFAGSSAGSTRWVLQLGDNTPETGGNAGTNITITRFTDAGANNGTVLNIIRSTGVTQFAYPIVNGTSDRSLKENIAPIDDALDKVIALQGVSFNMISRPDTREIGLIAQEVEPIVPELIQPANHFDPETETTTPKLAVDYSRLTALLVEAIKTLAARVTALETAEATS